MQHNPRLNIVSMQSACGPRTVSERAWEVVERAWDVSELACHARSHMIIKVEAPPFKSVSGYKHTIVARKNGSTRRRLRMSHQPSEQHQIASIRSLIRTGARRNPVTCGTNQGNCEGSAPRGAAKTLSP